MLAAVSVIGIAQLEEALPIHKLCSGVSEISTVTEMDPVIEKCPR